MRPCFSSDLNSSASELTRRALNSLLRLRSVDPIRLARFLSSLLRSTLSATAPVPMHKN